MKKIFLLLFIFFSFFQTTNANVLVVPFDFENQWWVEVWKFWFINQWWVHVLPFWISNIPLTNSDYVRYWDYNAMKSNIEFYDSSIEDIWTFSWTTPSAIWEEIHINHLNELRDKLILIQNTAMMLADYPNWLFLDDNWNSISPPNFNIVFYSDIFENAYKKLLNANNLLPTWFTNQWWVEIIPSPYNL